MVWRGVEFQCEICIRSIENPRDLFYFPPSPLLNANYQARDRVE